MLQRFLTFLNIFLIVASAAAESHDKLLIAENFDKFTKGSETAPDKTDLCLEELGWCISPDLLQTPGWNGGGIYQAGGCAMIYAYFNDFDNNYYLGYLESPRFDTTASRGEFTVCFRARTVLEQDWLGVCGVPTNQKEAQQKFAVISQDWGYYEVTLQCGDGNTSVQFEPLSDGCFIDDIRIIQVIDDTPDVPEYALDTPVILPVEDYSPSGYTAQWLPVDDADDYAVYDYLYYTARSDGEAFDYINTDFSLITEGSIDTPVEPAGGNDFYFYLDDIVGRADWIAYMPMYGGGSLAFDNSYSSMMPSGIESPTLHLACPDSDLELSFDIMSPTLTSLGIYAYGQQAMVGSLMVPITSEWKKHHITIPQCPDGVVLEMVVENAEAGYVFLDNLRVWQTLPAGTTAHVATAYYETPGTSLRIDTPSTPAGYRHAFSVSAYKYKYDEEGDVIDYDMSPWTEPTFADGLSPEGIIRTRNTTLPSYTFSLNGRTAAPADRLVIKDGRKMIVR